MIITMPAELKAASKLVESITAPLGFYVLALLIVETLFAVALASGRLTESSQMTALCMGATLFLIVVGVVTVLVWRKPENLTFDKHAHLTKAEYGTDEKPAVQKSPMSSPEAQNQETKNEGVCN